MHVFNLFVFGRRLGHRRALLDMSGSLVPGLSEVLEILTHFQEEPEPITAR
jgi:hypothetical protein